MAKSEKVKITKDYNAFGKSRLVIMATIITIILLVPICIYLILSIKKKAKPIVKFTGVDNGDNNLLLTVGQTDNQLASSGYDFAQLGQPCSDDSQPEGLPNLPDSYQPQPCDSSKFLVCVSGLLNGSICLSDLGGFCNTLNDCVNAADICLNNICSSTQDTLNTNCTSDIDCRRYVFNKNTNESEPTFNHICVNNLCKVNTFPYDSGCNTSNDCLAGNICSTDIYNGVSISIDSGNSFSLVNNKLVLADLNNLVALVESRPYLITNWQEVSNVYKGNLIPTGTNKQALLSGQQYNMIVGQKEKGYCLEPMIEGGRADLTIGNITIPCQEGLQAVGTQLDGKYCLKSSTPALGEVCVDNISTCQDYTLQPATVNEKAVDYKLDCSYDYLTEQKLINNNYNNIFPNSNNLFKVGNCMNNQRLKDQPCDYGFNGCAPPFVCLTESNEDGLVQSLCNTPFQAQIPVKDQCPQGYKIDTKQELCLSESDNICYKSSDCVSNRCGNNYFVSAFDPTVGLYTGNTLPILKNVSNIPNNVNFKTFNPVNNKNIFPNIENTFVPNNIVAWFPKENSNDYLVEVTDGTNTRQLNITLSDKQKLKDVIVDEDRNLLLLYQQTVSDTMRKRNFPVLDIDTTNDFFKIPDYAGLRDGTSVLVSPHMVAGDVQVYTLRKEGTGSINIDYSLQLNGNKVALTDNGQTSIITTYDNRYTFHRLENNSRNNPYLLSPNFDDSGNLGGTQLYQGDQLKLHNINATNPSIGSSLPALPGDSNTDPRFNSYTLRNDINYYVTPLGNTTLGFSGVLSNDIILFGNDRPANIFNSGISTSYYHNYAISDEYYHAVGGFPTLDNTKSFQQRVILSDPASVADEPYFTLNGDSQYYTYGIVGYNLNNLSKSSYNINISDNDKYLLDFDENNYRINGINQGITYIYNDPYEELSLTSKKLNNKNYLMINKGICFATGYNDNTNYNNQMVQIEYDIITQQTLNPAYSFDNNNYQDVFISNDGLGTYTTFKFNIVNTALVNENKGFYFANQTNRSNNVDNLSLNENNSVFYTLKQDKDIGARIENGIAINSKFENLNFEKDDNYQPTNEYVGFNNFEKLKPLELDKIYNITDRTKNNQNYFVSSNVNNFIYFHNSQDIDTILNFSASELVITKYGSDMPAPKNDFIYENIKAKYQMNLAIVEIAEYNVTMDSEYLIVRTNVPLIYDLQDYIINHDSPWLLNVYNFVPLEYYSFYGDSVVQNINDGSLFFTATKGTSFFANVNNQKEITNQIYRTGYNQVMTAGYSNGIHPSQDNDFIEVNNTYSIYNVNDGAGVDLGTGTPTNPTAYAAPRSYNEPSLFYKINNYVSLYDKEDTEPGKQFTTLPDKMPYALYNYPQFSPARVPPFDEEAVAIYSANNTSSTNPRGDYYTYYTLDGTTPEELTSFNLFSNDQYFKYLLPINNSSIDFLNGSLGTNFLPLPNEGTATETADKKGFILDFYYEKKESDVYSQGVFDGSQVHRFVDNVNKY